MKPGILNTDYMLAILNSRSALSLGFSHNILVFVLPQFMAFALFAWWDDIDLFYRARQPWAGLARLNVTLYNVTLNYLDEWFTLRKSVRLNHTSVTLLSFGSIITFILPALLAKMYWLESGSQRVRELSGSHPYIWDESAINRTTLAATFEIPVTVIHAIVKAPKSIDGVVNNEAILSVEFDVLRDNPPPQPGTFWQAQTKSLRVQLDCVPLTNSTITYARDPDLPGDQPQEVHIKLPEGLSFANGQLDLAQESCNPAFIRKPSPSTTGIFFCAHWILEDVQENVTGEIQPVWLIPTVRGDLVTWRPAAGPLLKHGFRTFVLACLSNTFAGEGTIDLVSSVNKTSGTKTMDLRGYRREESVSFRMMWEQPLPASLMLRFMSIPLTSRK